MLEGISELPLHEGRVPLWLLSYMKRLGRAIAMYIIDEFGPSELVKRLADPFWFQAFNNVIGMDWDSSGSTTVVIYVLKSFANIETFKDTGLVVLGGKGSDAKNILREIEKLYRYDIDTEYLEKLSRISAKIDSTALQDGYTLYIHSLILSRDGLWTVVQQGMNIGIKMARRYHIHSYRYIDIENDPHSGIACNRIGVVLNLVDKESDRARKAILDIANETSLNSLINTVAKINKVLKGARDLSQWMNKSLSIDIDRSIETRIRELRQVNPLFYRPITDIHRVEKILTRLRQYKPATFEELLLFKGLGPETLRALALVADLIYYEKPSFRDPVTHALDPFIYAYAHGGKDGIPYPVKIEIMKQTLEFLYQAIEESKIEEKHRKQALKRLAQFTKTILRNQ